VNSGRWNDLLKRIRATHGFWQRALEDMTLEQVNHHERAGVLPIGFSLFHFVTGEDRAVSERLQAGPILWSAEWAERTGIALAPIKRGDPIEVAETIRLTDLAAWREYQTAVFTRTEATLANMDDARWNEVLYEEAPLAMKGGFIGHLAGDGPVLLGDLMDVFIYQHGLRHLGEIEHARSLVGLQGVG
jgi:hypothetical protein